MRVSNGMNYEQVKSNIAKNRSEMIDLQSQAATNKRINKPSDDPVGTAKVLALRTDGLGNQQFMKNMEMAKNFLGYTETALSDISGLIVRAKELAVGQASEASSNAETRIATSAEVDQMFGDLVAAGNRRLGERYIFGGYKTTNSPFGNLGEYSGDQGRIKVEISKGVFAAVNLPGDRVFLGNNNGISLIPEDRRGSNTPNYPAVPQSEFEPANELIIQDPIEVRGPASIKTESNAGMPQGENIFNVFKTLSDGLRANDTVVVQSTLERLDSALEQVVLARSQVGARMASIQNTYESLAKGKIDDSTLLSSIEDADAFEVFTDITKNENALKAALQTSGKLIQPSLLDFLR